MFYIIIMCLAVILILPLKKYKNSKVGKILFVLSFLVSFLPAGLRYGIGTDYFYTYVPYFNWIGTGEKEFGEIGFNLLNKFIYDTSGDYRVLFFVTSFIILGFIYKAIWDNSDDILKSILIIFIGQTYFYSMNIVRQAIAMAIILYAFKFLKDKKYLKLLICIIIAALFHSSALLMIPILLISQIRIRPFNKIIIIILLFAFQPIILKVVEMIIGLTKYNWYYKSGLYTENIALSLIIQNIIIFIIDSYYQKVYKDKITTEYNILSNINFFGICTMALSMYIPLIYRIIRYCTIFQILFIPKMLNLSRIKSNKSIITAVIILLLFVCMVYQIILCGGEEVYPYVSIFNRR